MSVREVDAGKDATYYIGSSSSSESDEDLKVQNNYIRRAKTGSTPRVGSLKSARPLDSADDLPKKIQGAASPILSNPSTQIDGAFRLIKIDPNKDKLEEVVAGCVLGIPEEIPEEVPVTLRDEIIYIKKKERGSFGDLLR